MKKILSSAVNFILIFNLFFLFSLESCKSPTAPNRNDLSLNVSDVSCTEAWITLSSNNVPLPANILIKKNGNEFLNINLVSKDTTLNDNTLLPNQTYSYQAVYNNGFNLAMSEVVSAKTMDTTSNNYSWKLYTLGDVTTGNSSSLRDIVLINDTLAYAVGEIYSNDSTGQNSTFPYNLAKWNGNEWKLNKVPVKYKGNQTVAPLTGIFVLQDTNIILSSGLPYLPDGKGGWELYQLWNMGVLNNNDGSVNHIWGKSITDLYFVGNSGTIVHYTNGTWQKVASGTGMDLLDIYSNDGNNIYIGGGVYSNYSGVLLKGNDNSFQILKEGENINANQIFNPYFAGVAASVWVSNINKIYFCGHFLYRYAFGQLGYVTTLPGNYIDGNDFAQNWGLINKIRGNNDNDIIMVGERNTIMHFNGIRWKQIGMPYDPNSHYDWLSISMKGNTAIAVGFMDMNAVIMVLKRQ